MKVSIMKNQFAKFARFILCVMGLVIVQGCATTQDYGSAKPWSQTAAEEYQSEQFTGPDFSYLP